MLSICKVFCFEAAHKLRGYPGNCAHLHGHSYVVEVEVGPWTVEKKFRPLDSMVMDLKILSDLVKPIINDLDHSNLNDLIDEPTAETICYYFLEHLKKVEPDLNIIRIRVWETSTSYAEWRK